MLSLGELAERLGVSQALIRAWRKEGLPCDKKGNKLQFDPAAVAEWLEMTGRAERESSEPPDQIATTAAEAAQLLGVSKSTVDHWAARPDFPGRPGKPGRQEAYFPIGAIRRWQAETFGTGDETTAAASRLGALRERKLEIDAERSALALEQQLAQILDLADTQRFFAFAVATAKSILEDLADRIESRLPTKLPPKIRARIRAVVDRSLVDAYAAIEQVLGEDADAKDGDEEEPSA